MTTAVHSVSEDTPAAKAADLMLRHHVKRLPVLREAKVIGIVSRADLVRTFLGTGQPAEPVPIRAGVALEGGTQTRAPAASWTT